MVNTPERPQGHERRREIGAFALGAAGIALGLVGAYLALTHTWEFTHTANAPFFGGITPLFKGQTSHEATDILLRDGAGAGFGVAGLGIAAMAERTAAPFVLVGGLISLLGGAFLLPEVVPILGATAGAVALAIPFALGAANIWPHLKE